MKIMTRFFSLEMDTVRCDVCGGEVVYGEFVEIVGVPCASLTTHTGVCCEIGMDVLQHFTWPADLVHIPRWKDGMVVGFDMGYVQRAYPYTPPLLLDHQRSKPGGDLYENVEKFGPSVRQPPAPGRLL